MSSFGFKKEGYYSSSSVTILKESDISDRLTSPEISEQLEKFARSVQKIAPKSDDFLYFSIIFMKAAESSTIDDFGNTKKVGNEDAYGFFDENWKWHGNVKAHRNNNSDIFSESELKKYYKDWVGKPLCVDHKSDSVDGIRGIILDTHYDEKLKQVVGLCALDKVNYPDLARKVQTGVVRFGSMGTNVAESICFDCLNKAASPALYCNCIKNRTTYGEINVGLRPIEYSLVVQPAEPGARLLRCFASIKNHESDFQKVAINVDEFLPKLSTQQADDLDRLLNIACYNGSCSLSKRANIIKAYGTSVGLVKTAALSADQEKEIAFAQALSEISKASGMTPEDEPELFAPLFRAFDRKFPEKLTSDQLAEGTNGIQTQDDQGTKGTGTESAGMVASVTEPNDTFNTDGVGPEHYAFAAEDRIELSKLSKEINKLSEDIMNEARLRKRAESRKKAYMQGGSDGIEPNTFKSEDYKKYWEADKHMHANPKTISDDGTMNDDKAVKEKLSRASEKLAYHQGGSDGIEPNTFKSEDYKKYWEADKHMHANPKTISDDGVMNDDKAVKEKLSRAALAPLSAKFIKKFNADNSLNKEASCLEVYSDGKLILASTAKDIFGPKLAEKWTWVSSKDYLQTVVAAIRADGLEKVASMIVKKSQELPAMPEAPAEPAMPEMTEPAPEMPEMSAPSLEASPGAGSPSDEIESALVDMEQIIEDIRGAIGDLGEKDLDINVNIGDKELPAESEKLALSAEVLKALKIALAESNESADELAKLSEAYDQWKHLSASKRKELNKLANESIKESYVIIGEATANIKLAGVASSFVKNAKKVKAAEVTSPFPKTSKAPQSELYVKAMRLRTARRNDLLKKAMEMSKEMEAKTMENNMEAEMNDEAHDGIGMQKSVTPTSSAPMTPARSLAEKSVQVHMAKDDALDKKEEKKVKEIADKEAEKEVEKHEDKMHEKEEKKEASVKAEMKKALDIKKAAEEKEMYQVRVRRSYDLAHEMQRKGTIPQTKIALEQKVDELLNFNDEAFDSMKRLIAGLKDMSISKKASDASVPNVGISRETSEVADTDLKSRLSDMWKTR